MEEDENANPTLYTQPMDTQKLTRNSGPEENMCKVKQMTINNKTVLVCQQEAIHKCFVNLNGESAVSKDDLSEKTGYTSIRLSS